MLAPEPKTPLLLAIKDSIENIILANRQATDAFSLTDELRHDILSTLVIYSDRIPHPARGASNTNSRSSNTLMRWQILACFAGID